MTEPSPCWRAYGGHWLVLPQVELSSGETIDGRKVKRARVDALSDALKLVDGVTAIASRRP